MSGGRGGTPEVAQLPRRCQGRAHRGLRAREGADPDHVARDIAGSMGLPFAVLAARMRETFDQSARFTPVLRFVLADEAKRTFCVERWCYLGSIDDWVDIGAAGQLGRLVKQTVPKSGQRCLFRVDVAVGLTACSPTPAAGSVPRWPPAPPGAPAPDRRSLPPSVSWTSTLPSALLTHRRRSRRSARPIGCCTAPS